MNLKIKLLHPNARMPEYKTAGASGMDLYAVEECVIYPGRTKRIPLGFSLEVPPGFEAQIRPRSSLSADGILGHFGTIDSDYRGELAAVLTNTQKQDLLSFDALTFAVAPGDRIAQLVIAPVARVNPQKTDQLTETDRGAGGFGSTGK